MPIFSWQEGVEKRKGEGNTSNKFISSQCCLKPVSGPFSGLENDEKREVFKNF